MTRNLSTVLQKNQEVAESWALKLVHGKHLPSQNFISLEIVVNGTSTQAAPVVYHISIQREDLSLYSLSAPTCQRRNCNNPICRDFHLDGLQRRWRQVSEDKYETVGSRFSRESHMAELRCCWDVPHKNLTAFSNFAASHARCDQSMWYWSWFSGSRSAISPLRQRSSILFM